MNNSAIEKSAVVLIIGILEILGGIFLVILSLAVNAEAEDILWGTVAGIVFIISGFGLMRMLEWARILSIILCLLLFLAGFAYLVLTSNPLAQSDRLYGGGLSDNMVFMISMILMATGLAGVRLLGKYKDKFRKG